MLGGHGAPAQLAPFRGASIVQRTVVHGGIVVEVVEGTGIVVGVVPMVVLVVVDVAPAVVVVVDVPPSVVVVLVVVGVVVVVEPGLQTAMPPRPSARPNWNATWPLAVMPMCFRPMHVSGANL